MSEILVREVKKAIRNVPDFPKKGIMFRDITPLLMDHAKFKACVDFFGRIPQEKIDYVVSIESRGFIFGSALAYALNAGFVPIRKKGKLPHKTYESAYDLEYGSNSMEIHVDALHKGARVVLIDDVLATGGTMKAATELVAHSGAEILGIYFLIELLSLHGREKLRGHPVISLVQYE